MKAKDTVRLTSNTVLITEDHLKLAVSLVHSCCHLYAGSETRAHRDHCSAHWLIHSPSRLPPVGFVTVPAGDCVWVWVEEPQLNFRGRYLGLVLALSSASHLLMLHQHYQACLDSASKTQSPGVSVPSCCSLHPVHTQQPRHYGQ